ncbi:MAG: hypothetical protein U5L09_15840 [Bacteroidales bacterium]|nr:hypothetical protein [Bacteroidales bacterium]
MKKGEQILLEQSWNDGIGKYTVKDVAYDLNGNLTDLTRYSWSSAESRDGGPPPAEWIGPIDKLSYNYQQADGILATGYNP